MDRSRIFSMVSQKGGVGKTTTAVNLGLAFAAHGERVLMVDADPQGGTLYSLMGTVSHERPFRGLLQVLSGEGEIVEFARPTMIDGLQVIDSGVSHTNLTDYEEAAKAHRLFREVVRSAATAFDVVLLDCPPGVGVVTTGVLAASDYVIVPIQSEPLSLRTLPQLFRHMIEAKRHVNHNLDIAGLLITMFDPMNTTSQVVAQQIRQHFHDDMVFLTTIPRDPAMNLIFAPTDSLTATLNELQSYSVGLKAYRELADELDRRFPKQELIRTPSAKSFAGVT